jgi:hypothetical protein
MGADVVRAGLDSEDPPVPDRGGVVQKVWWATRQGLPPLARSREAPVRLGEGEVNGNRVEETAVKEPRECERGWM